MAFSIINISISTSKLIDDRKVEKVVPLYKSIDSSDVMNYRPISILSVPSKIVEHNIL